MEAFMWVRCGSRLSVSPGAPLGLTMFTGKTPISVFLHSSLLHSQPRTKDDDEEEYDDENETPNRDKHPAKNLLAGVGNSATPELLQLLSPAPIISRLRQSK
jgi:hypothetical protein